MAADDNEPQSADADDPRTAAEVSAEERRNYLVRRFWRSALGFWRPGGHRRAWLLSGTVVGLVVLYVAVQYGLNVWNRALFDALGAKDAGAVFKQTLIFPLLAALSVLFGVLLTQWRMAMQRAWRGWLNGHVLDYWLGKGRYFQLNLVRGEHQNPEYRIAEDLRIATEAPVDFTTGLLQAVLSAITFIVVLWTIGGALTVTIAGHAVTIPGFLVIAAFVYAGLASGSMLLIGRRFTRMAEEKNQAEAEYRYVLTRVRENGESIALLGGEDEERAGIDRSMKNVLRRWRDLCTQYMRTTVVSFTSGQIAPFLPVLLSAPKYLEGSMSLGEVMQAASAFVTVQAAFAWLVDNYPRFADWSASARRVSSLLVSIDALEEAEKAGVGYITQDGTDDAALALENLSVTLDDGTGVIKDAQVSIAPGERVLVVGESGTGKSTLVRALAGLWPWGGGKILFKYGAKLFLLPQRPYIPVGSLLRAVAYPTPAEEVDRASVEDAMEAVGLGKFVPRLDEETAWDQTLSGGEKQRLAFARVLIQRPTIVVLDEATSALDPPSQEKMMNLLPERLPETTIISVAHRPELEAFHERKLVMEPRPGGARLVRDIDLVSRFWGGRKRRKPARRAEKTEAA